MRCPRVALTLAAVALVAGCGTAAAAASGQAACTAAMSADYAQARAHPGGPADAEPAACKGLSQAQVTRIAGQIIGAQLTGPAPSPSPSPGPMFTDPNGTVCRSPGPADPGFGSGVCPQAGS